MNTRRLGATDLHLTTIGLGTWAIGGGGWAFAWGPQDDRESERTIHRALELGINWIDTAPVYGTGHSEEIIGQTLAGRTQRPILATKGGRSWTPDRNPFPCLKKEVIQAEIDASLQRLRIDTIDLYQLHWPQPEPDIEEAWGVVADGVKAGKIRHGGVSNFSVAQIQRIQPILPVASVQSPYSMLAREIEHELLPYCAEHKIGVVTYSPMQKGLLAGGFTRERVKQFAGDDHRRNDPQFQEPRLSANLELVEGLNRIAQKHGKTTGQLAIAWVLRRPEVTAAIVGARKPAQIEDTVGASDWTLTTAEVAAIELLLAKRRSQEP